MGEFVPTEAPLEGELAAQLTEGSRLGLWPSLAPEAQIPGFWNIRVCIPPPAEAFLKKSRTPQTRLSPGQLPFQESQGLVRIRPGVLRTGSAYCSSSAALFGRHLPRRGSFRTRRCGGPLSPMGKVGKDVHKLPRNSLQNIHAYSPIHAIMGSIRKN